MSVGRGTKEPFRNIGMPGFKEGKNYFKPISTAGAKEPKYKNLKCRGIYLSDSIVNNFLANPKIEFQLLAFAYKNCPNRSNFFTEKGSFNILAGNKKLKRQIAAQVESLDNLVLNLSWKPELDKFKLIRKKYLLYPDYE